MLTLAIAERDARIAALERDLAVERAKSAQLLEFVKSGGEGVSPSPPLSHQPRKQGGHHAVDKEGERLEPVIVALSQQQNQYSASSAGEGAVRRSSTRSKKDAGAVAGNGRGATTTG